jgi:hypothetical protein
VFPIYVKELETDPPEDPIYYLVTGDGIFLVKNHPLFHSRTKVKEIPWLPGEQAGFSFRGPRLPSILLARVLAFFMRVWERYRAESIVILYFKPLEGAYGIVVPRQRVGGIHCVYEETAPEDSEHLRVGTIHSHGHEDAFHSDKDNADESHQDGLHLIFGNLDAVPTLLCSAMVDGRRFPLSPEELIEGLPGRKDLLPWRDWVDRQIEEHVEPLEKPIYFGT